MSVRASVLLLPTEEGGLREPMTSPSQSLLMRLIDSETDVGVRVATDSAEPLTPGASAEVTLTFWDDPPEVQRMTPGTQFTLRYPTRVVGRGRVQAAAS